MNISYRWLTELVPGGVEAPEELAERLALLGFPVEGAEDLAEGLRDIVVGKVLEAGPHPDADRLRLCAVDAGTGERLQVVCGAPNVEAGRLYPFIPVGGVLPDGMKIRKAKIRGTHSFGMLCSPRELGLGQDHDGILALNGSYEPGTSFVEAMGLDDLRLDVEVTSNRGDLLSHVGVARELRPDAGALSLPDIPGAPEEVALEWIRDDREVVVDGVTVTNHEPDACRRFTGAVIRGVTVRPSPDWLQMRLRAVGLRPINNVVDATNYVLMELGQPLHAYDLDRLQGNRIQVRRARDGEKVETLDGETHTLSGEMLVIADGEATVDIAGIMGDDRTSVTRETANVFLECAHFEAPGIRTTKKTLGIQSDAGYRFERFVDPAGQERALVRCLEVILATAGGTLHPKAADVQSRPWETTTVSLRLSRLERVLGVPFTADRVNDLLEPLGFELEAEDDDTLRVTIPSWRGADVTREVDLVEEVARRHGFHRFPDDLGAFRPGNVPDHPLFRLEDRLRDHLVASGWYEAQTPAFVPESEGEVRLQNPLSREEPVLRRELAPSLLRRIEYNLARGNRNVRLFELGTSFRSGGEDGRPREEARLAVVLTGDRAPRHWSAPPEALDLWDLKVLLEECAALAWGGHVRLEPGPAEGFPGVEGAAWSVVHEEGRILGGGGIVAPSRLDLPPWAGDVLAFELGLPSAPGSPKDVTMRALPGHPGSERDLALLVPVDVPAGDLLERARSAAGEHLESVEIFDVYQGEGVPEGRRSLALRFRFRAAGRTLTDDEVESATRAITHRLAEEWGVHVRGAD